MRLAVGIIGFALASGAHAADLKWECHPIASTKTEVWLTGNLKASVGEVRTSRLTHVARFGLTGFTYVRSLEDGRFQLFLDPGGTGKLYDVTGAAKDWPGELTNMFKCTEKRNNTEHKDGDSPSEI